MAGCALGMYLGHSAKANNFRYSHSRNDYLLTCTFRMSSCNGIVLNHYECRLRCVILLLNHTPGVATERSQQTFDKVYISATATLLLRFLPAYAWGQILYYVNQMPPNGTIVSEMPFMRWHFGKKPYWWVALGTSFPAYTASSTFAAENSENDAFQLVILL